MNSHPEGLDDNGACDSRVTQIVENLPPRHSRPGHEPIVVLRARIKLRPDFSPIGIESRQRAAYLWAVELAGVGDEDELEAIQPMPASDLGTHIDDLIEVGMRGRFTIAA
jgi:hypothetical protein